MEGGASNSNNPSLANSILDDEGNISTFFQSNAAALAANAPSGGYVALLQGEGEVNAVDSNDSDIDLNIDPIISNQFSHLVPIPGGQTRYIPYSSIGPFHDEAESSNAPRCRCGKRRRLDENEASTSSASQEFCECELELTSTSHPVPSLTLPQVRSSSTSTQVVLPSVHASSFSTSQPGPSQMPQHLPLPNLLGLNVASTSANQPGGYFGHVNPGFSFLPMQNGQETFGSVGQQPFRAPGILIRDVNDQGNGGDQTFAGAISSNTRVLNRRSVLVPRRSPSGTAAAQPITQNAPRGLISTTATHQPALRPPSAMLLVQEALTAASRGGVNWSFTSEQLQNFIHMRPPVSVGLIRARPPAPTDVIVIDDDDEVDAHREMRLDVDGMSYEELLALGDQIGYVNTGLTEDIIQQRIQRRTLESTPEQNESCCICLEEYASAEMLGKLNCSHEFHFDCIKQWLQEKNSCPVCKKPAAES